MVIFTVKRLALYAFTALALCSCSKNQDSQPSANGPIQAESFPIENTKFKNCNFHDQTPSYAVNAAITPDYISCDEGVAKTVTLLSATKLPVGLSFDTSKLSLVGTPTEKVTNAPYDFYIENEAGYLILHLVLTVK